jgi:hypothetical protein
MESQENQQARLLSIPIAMMMAVVAMLGATVAYRAALAEHETLRSERRLQQGKVLELAHRQEILNKLANRTRYEYSQYVYLAEAQNDLKEARQLSTADPGRAALLTLRAQEDHAVVRALRAYLNFFWVDLPRSLEESLQQSAANQLSEYGFDARWVEPKSKGESAPSIWENAERYLEQERLKVVRLAGAVLLFVVALAFLTFAQLSLKNVGRENVLVCAGILIALFGLFVAVWADRSSWRTLLLALCAFGVLVLVGRKVWQQKRLVDLVGEWEPVHPSEVEPTLFPGVRVHAAPVAHGFGRFTIFMIAVTAVLSALSGLLYSRATAHSAAAFSEVLESQGTLFKTNSSNGTTFFNTVGDMSTAQEYLVHYEAARQRVDLARENPSILDQRTALEQLSHWNLLLNSLSDYNKGLKSRFTGAWGPEQDRNFPRKLVNQGRKDSERAFAMSDASNERSLLWQRRATTYLAMLTLFAIALYLFGQALSMGRTRDAFILVVFSCCLVLYSFGYGVFMSWEFRTAKKHSARPECQSGEKPDDDPVQDAARHYAEGRTLYESSSDDPEELAKAAREFGCAVDVRPTFAMGNYYYALLTQLAKTPQLNENSFVSLTSKESLPIITKHEQQALKMIEQQGLKPPVSSQADYGFDSTLEGLLQGDRKQLELGIAETRKGIALDEIDLVPKFNLGLGLLADGKKEEGLAVYEQAMKQGLKGQGAILAGAITDLDILHRYCGGIHLKATNCQEIDQQVIPRLKSEMVAAAWPPNGPSRVPIHPKPVDLQLTATTTSLSWRAPEPTLDKNRDVLSVLWYAYNPEWETWRVLPVVSGAADWKLDYQGMASDFRSVLFATWGRTCVADGTYRAELYLNGEVAGTEDITTQHGKLLPVVFPTLNLAMCYPQSWNSWEAGDAQASSFIKGYTDDSGTRGIFLFTYFNPRQQPDQVSQDHYLAEAEAFLVSHNLTPRPTGAGKITDCAGQLGYLGETLTAFNNGYGSAVARTWMEQDGLAHVAVAFDNAQNRRDCDTLMSVTTIY